MNIKAIDKENNIMFVAGVKNKKEAREYILSHRRMHEIVTIQYGRKQYSISDVYGRF